MLTTRIVTPGDVKNYLGSQLMIHLSGDKTVGPKSPKKFPLAHWKQMGLQVLLAAHWSPFSSQALDGSYSQHPVAPSKYYLALAPDPLPKQVPKLVRSWHLQEDWKSRQTGANKSHTAHPLLSSRKHKPHPGHSALRVSALLIGSTAPTTNHALPQPMDNNPDSQPATTAWQAKN